MSSDYKYITYTRRHMEEALSRSDKFYVVEYKKLCAVITGLREENARLREALRVIADGTWFESECRFGPYTGLNQNEIARDALEGKK
jgi:hypothetical protein